MPVDIDRIHEKVEKLTENCIPHIQSDIAVIKDKQKTHGEMLEKVDTRTWWILGSIILSTLVGIAVAIVI